jgi:cell division protein FtsB
MAYASEPLPSSLYRPKKLPRVIRRQLPVVLLCAGITLVGLLAWAVTWKNLTNERLNLDVGQQQLQIETLRKEIQHLEGQVDTETSYPRIAKWARDKRGWRPLPDHSGVVRLSQSELTPAARDQARLLKGAAHD